jgi:DNA-binding response OmpR family regulator
VWTAAAADAGFELPHLLALQPEVEPACVVLDDADCTLGRAAVCEVVVPFPFVSRLHSRISLVEGRFQIHDRRSSNGTFVNGERVDGPRVLANHDLIGLGEAGPHLTYVDPDPTQSAATRLIYDERSMQFSLGAERLDLTPNQFRLLRWLHRHRGEVCARAACAEAVWGAQYAPGMDATTLDRLVSSLRACLRRADPTNQLVVTRPSLGYLLDDAA